MRHEGRAEQQRGGQDGTGHLRGSSGILTLCSWVDLPQVAVHEAPVTNRKANTAATADQYAGDKCRAGDKSRALATNVAPPPLSRRHALLAENSSGRGCLEKCQQRTGGVRGARILGGRADENEILLQFARERPDRLDAGRDQHIGEE